MLEFHSLQAGAVATVLGTEATRQQSLNYGCVVEDKVPATWWRGTWLLGLTSSSSPQDTHAVLHYVEKPSTYISSTIR